MSNLMVTCDPKLVGWSLSCPTVTDLPQRPVHILRNLVVTVHKTYMGACQAFPQSQLAVGRPIELLCNMRISHCQIGHETAVLERIPPNESFHVWGYLLSGFLSHWSPHVPDFLTRGFSQEGIPLVACLLSQSSHVRVLHKGASP